MKTMSQRRQELLNVFDRHEEMGTLFACLARSPALWGDEDEVDAEEEDLMDALVARGLLTRCGLTCTTTAEGIEALIAYIKDED